MYYLLKTIWPCIMETWYWGWEVGRDTYFSHKVCTHPSMRRLFARCYDVILWESEFQRWEIYSAKTFFLDHAYFSVDSIGIKFNEISSSFWLTWHFPSSVDVLWRFNDICLPVALVLCLKSFLSFFYKENLLQFQVLVKAIQQGSSKSI